MFIRQKENVDWKKKKKKSEVPELLALQRIFLWLQFFNAAEPMF